MASVSISCPSCSATDGVVRNGKSTSEAAPGTAGTEVAVVLKIGGAA
ncbi:hypothetical protein CXB26_28410 (plasmid) [Klebsiella pneumoniae]|nr:hypothetical protein CXB26_28410 [Klebsiella pneumoniae]AUD31837.1 hypothetical protein CXB24_28400 [Klebsiella pneumoniae]AUD37365.1 hypothetical protein CXB25_28415 [Klebsiella pneumoniae]